MSYLSEYLAEKNALKNNKELLDFYREFNEIIDSNEIDWEEKFQLGFKLKKDKYPNVHIDDYYDPDTTYEEDIMAFYNAVKKQLERERG